jgi:hypothetical protein
VLAAGSIRGANKLHENGGRLWSSVPYTALWLVGWLSILLMSGPLIALFVRHRGVLGRIGIAATGAVALVSTVLLPFHLSNDGSFTRGDPNTWRSIAIATAGVAAVALVVMIRRRQLIPQWPLMLVATGLALIAAHYFLLDERSSLALFGMACLAAAGVAYTLILVKERPLA